MAEWKHVAGWTHNFQRGGAIDGIVRLDKTAPTYAAAWSVALAGWEVWLLARGVPFWLIRPWRRVR